MKHKILKTDKGFQHSFQQSQKPQKHWPLSI
jgi:hypothetical protein